MMLLRNYDHYMDVRRFDRGAGQAVNAEGCQNPDAKGNFSRQGDDTLAL